MRRTWIGRPVPRTKRQQEEWEGWIADREDERRQAVEANRRRKMTHRRTAAGEVEHFPDGDPIRQRVTKVRSALLEALDEAERVAEANRRMAASTQPDRIRFGTGAGGGLR